MSIKSRVVLGSAIALFALSACNDKDKANSAPTAAAAADSKEAVAATVNGTPILKNNWIRSCSNKLLKACLTIQKHAKW